jgi:Ca-activated chloride channel family protein
VRETNEEGVAMKRYGRMRAGVWAAAVAGLAWLVAAPASAGWLFFAGEMKDGAFVPAKGQTGPCFRVEYSTIAARLEGGTATVTVQEDVRGPDGAPVDAIGILPLPDGLAAGAVALRATGPDGQAADVAGESLPAEAAGKMLEAVAKAADAAAALAYVGRPAFFVPRLRLTPKLRLDLTLRQTPRETGGLFALAFPMPETGFAGKPVERLTFAASLRHDLPIRAVFSPTHDLAVERTGPREVSLTMRADGFAGAGDLTVRYAVDRDPLGLRLVAHRLKDEPEGYFMLVGNPSGDDGAAKPLPKDLVLVLDTSGSMRGEKMEQARAALEYCLARLNEGDRFNVIAFGTEVSRFSPTLAARTPDNLKRAAAFVDDLSPLGRTNIGGALEKALEGAAEPGRPRIVLFLTDGAPTAGERAPDKILARLAELKDGRTRLYVVGVGHDVNTRLLDKMAELTDGQSEYLGPGEEIDTKVAAIYNRLTHPVLANVAVSFGDLAVSAMYPRKIPALFRGGDIVLLGRYRGGGKHKVTISGELAGEPKTHAYEFEFPESVTPADEFVAVLWAGRKIGYLLQEIRLHGENKELVDEVVRLSRQFGIVTEYTEFIAASGGRMSEAEARERTSSRMKDAHREIGGKWAVAQVLNEKALQNAPSTTAMNAYTDRDGKVQSAERVRQVGRRAFYKQDDGQWVDAEGAGERKVRKVKYLSDEYFGLLRKNTEFAEAQRLGAGVEMNVADERVVVEK